jgi:hypothetical protein
MDFTQNKLTKAEWENLEVPVSASEKQILSMIMHGFNDVNINFNETLSMFSFTKIEKTPEVEYLLYKKYFEDFVTNTIKQYGKNMPIEKYGIVGAFNLFAGSELKQLKSADLIRIQNLDTNIQVNKPIIFEYLLLDLWKELVKQITKKKQKYAFYLYTLLQLKKASIQHINKYVMTIVDETLAHVNSFTKTSEIITNAYEFIEKNTHLLRYEDRTLFKHQKDLFTICKDESPKLILYTAPTGTGKTLSPIGLSEKYRVIFVCVARHIGLSLAKAAISVEKKIAFAFGCDTASDIRLHYFAAINYTKNRRSGGIGKVDNSVGDNVEIMICDVKSYITAMHYMLAFNPCEKIITYWDEPTITMDYDNHPLHVNIHRNWKENKIPTVVLSCATLPSSDEIRPVFDDFRSKFDNSETYTITSFDCKKSIPILNKDGFCVLPHFLYSDYKDLVNCAKYCSENKTLLRYFDLREIIRFIEYINEHGHIDPAYSIDSYFGSNITDITMNSLKEYYLEVIMRLEVENWSNIHKILSEFRKRKYSSTSTIKKVRSVEPDQPAKSSELTRTNSVCVPPKPNVSSGILFTTTDAYTLTDGPTIFLAENVNKIGSFYIQQSNIAPSVFQNLMSKIIHNGDIIKQIDKLESQILLKEAKSTAPGEKEDSKAMARESGRLCKESQSMMDQINKLRKEIRIISLDPMYVPNTRPHQQTWAPLGEIRENAFVSNISEEVVKTIMMLDIENHFKVLLLLGIGMFTDIKSIEYMEIMKRLAAEQKLFIIIASTDYVYGTNYQFCHGIIGKDLTKMTQQKTLQAMGRIGRNNIQQDYTIRFRDDDMITGLFNKPEHNLEAMNMCKLFCSDE